MSEKVQDTSSLLNEEDLRLMEAVQKVKYNITYYFKIEKICKKISSIIEESEVFRFASSRAAKFLDVRRPVFSIRYNREKTLKAYPPEREFREPKDELDWMFDCVYKEIISKFTEFIRKAISKDEESFMQLFKEGNDISEEAKEVIKNLHVLSSIFAVRIDVENALINFEYMK